MRNSLPIAMDADPLSPIAPVRLRVLLLPVGRIKRSQFLGFAERLQAENVIRLGDVSPDPRPNRNMFSPLAFPTGMILYDLSISVPPTSHLDLFPFEVFREPLVILAIADGEELATNPSGPVQEASLAPETETKVKHPTPKGLTELLGQLEVVKENNPRALVHQLLIFNYDRLDKLSNGPENVVWVPRPQASRATTMKTVLCDTTSILLGELDEFAKLMQSIPVIESPRAFSWGPRRGPELRPRPVDRLFQRMTMPAQTPPTSNGAPESGASSEHGSPAPSEHEFPTTFDEITRSIQLTNRTNATAKLSKEHSRDRMSAQGLSAADRTKNRIKGRLGVVIGTFYLQAGRWPDALKELVEAAAMARAGSDYIWHGKALESIILCLLMFGWAGIDFQIPQVCYPIVDKSSLKPSHSTSPPSSSDFPNSYHASPGNRVVSLQNLANLVPGLSHNILNLYNRAANITDEPLPQIVFSETVIRLSRLLSAIRIRDGSLDDNALGYIIMNEPLVPLYQPERPRGSVLLQKNEIANFLFRALPISADSELPTTDSVPILVGVASVLATLDLQRKKAFVLRQLLSIMIPALVHARKIGAAEVGIHPAAGLSSLTDTTFDINALDIGPGNMEEGMRALLTMIGETYGVQPPLYHEFKRGLQTYSGDLAKFDSVGAIAERSLRCLTLNMYGDRALKIDILKAAITLCEALPDFEGVLQFTVEVLRIIRGDLMLPDVSRTPPFLPEEEQVRLLNNINRTTGAIKKLGYSGLEAEYWDDFLVRGVELLDFPDFKKPSRRTKKELSATTIPTDRSSKDPFLYNPFSKPSSKSSELLLIAGEYASFKVILQNLYEFEIEIESLRLDSEGPAFDGVSQGIWLAPFSMQEAIVSGVAREEGILKIIGCIVKVRHCRQRGFPIFTALWNPGPGRSPKQPRLTVRNPLDRPSSWTSSTSNGGKVETNSRPETASCLVKVISKQPSVVIQSISLSQSALMILEGETKSFDITLQNSSSCPVDFILFAFQDSTTRQLQSALNNKDLFPIDAYELELQLSSKPSLCWRRVPGDLTIAAGETATFTVDVFGKPGLQDAVMQIDYCYLGTQGNIPEIFYTKQLLVPITITVNASVEVARCDIVPLTNDSSWFNRSHQDLPSRFAGNQESSPLASNASSQILPSLTNDNALPTPNPPHLDLEPSGLAHCLVILDLRNIWPSPLSIIIYVNKNPEAATVQDSFDQDDSNLSIITGDLQPGQASRFILVLPRIFLDSPHAPIPVLNTSFKRQFVVSGNKLSFEAEAASREAFWYREELLKRITGVWSENFTGRNGKVEFRNIRFNQRMVNAMRLEELEVTFSLSQLDSNPESEVKDEPVIIQTGRSKYIAKTNAFLNLTVTIHNRWSKPIHPLLRLQPSLRNQPNTIALDLSKRLAWTGMLQQVLPVLNGGETTQAMLGVTALCQGEYEFGASVEEVRVIGPPLQCLANEKGDEVDPAIQQEHREAKVASGSGDIEDTDVARERRIWYASESCVICAQD